MDIETANTNNSFYKYPEAGIKNRNPELWRKIMDYLRVDIPFKQKFYLFENRMSLPPKCSCGQDLKFIDMWSGYRKFCSRRCAIDCDDVKEKRKQTCIEKYGVENPSMSPLVKDQVKKTNLDRFGVEYPLQSDEIKKKTRTTFQEKYGVDNPSRVPEIRCKAEETNLARLGVRHAMHNESIKNKLLEYFREKFGVDNPSMLPHIRKKAMETMVDKYGEPSALKLDFFKEKSKKTSLQNCGKEYFTQTEAYREILKKKSFDNNSAKVNNGGYTLLDASITDYNIRCEKCFNIFTINRQLWRSRVRNGLDVCLKCNPMNNGISSVEKTLHDFIREKYEGIILENHRIGRKELDIFIPELSIGFEYNGLYWHSEANKTRNDHMDKLSHFRDREIKMHVIWEDDWNYRRDIVRSMVLNKLGIVDRRIYARKCEIREVEDISVIRDFLNANHIQGFVGSNIKLGLFENGELVALMTFGCLRRVLGHSSSQGEYELLRLCSRINTSVIGGASKLFKFFINKYQPTKVVSFSDSSRSSGNIYQKLGFIKESESLGGYFWFKNGMRHHRFTFRKDKLVKMGYDKTKTEVEIMHDLGYLRIWDYGQSKWVYSRDQD
jgi:hypothetical protein